jgi:hypothetical protein
MKRLFYLEVLFDSRHSDANDRARAEQAMYDAIKDRGVSTKEAATALLEDQEIRFEIMDIGTSALTKGWAKSGDDYVSGVSVY